MPFYAVLTSLMPHAAAPQPARRDALRSRRAAPRPRPQFLRQTAVEGVRPLTVWQALLGHEPTHACLHGSNISIAASEQVCENNALLRRVRMEGEMRPDKLQIIGSSESLNTSRT